MLYLGNPANWGLIRFADGGPETLLPDERCCICGRELCGIESVRKGICSICEYSKCPCCGGPLDRDVRNNHTRKYCKECSPQRQPSTWQSGLHPRLKTYLAKRTLKWAKNRPIEEVERWYMLFHEDSKKWGKYFAKR